MLVRLGLTLAACIAAAGPAMAQAPNLENLDVVMKSVPDGPVAKVNDTFISREAFLQLYETELSRAQNATGKNVPSGARVKMALWAVANLIRDELLYQEAERRGVTVRGEAVDKALDDRIERIRQSMAEQEGTELSEAAVIERLGFESRETLEEDVARVLLIEEMRTRIVEESGLTIGDDEVAKVYEEQKDQFMRPNAVHLKQIFIRESATNGAKQAEQALARIQSGQSFGAVARSVSQSGDAQNGGDMGAVPIERLPPFLADAALDLEPGQMSGVINSEYGYHIIKLVEIQEGSHVPLDEAAPHIRRRLKNQQGEEIVREYCDNLIKEEADVSVFLELEKNLSLDPGYDQLNLSNQ